MGKRIEPMMTSGGLLKLYQALWAPYYDAVTRALGDSGVILPIGDPHHGQPGAAAFSTRGGEQVTFTWSEAPGAFDTALDLTDPGSFQGIMPSITFNGTDEEADSPDAAFWARGDGANDSAMSLGAWVKINGSHPSAILARFDNTGSAEVREWRFIVDGGDNLELQVFDESANVGASRISDGAIPTDVWKFVVATYDGTGGADAMGTSGSVADNATLYFDGEIVASTATDNAAYVAMEDLGTPTTFAHRLLSGPAQLFEGSMVGGPLGPFFTPKELSSGEVRGLYDLGRAALGL